MGDSLRAKSHLIRFLSDEGGQATTEYILILTLAVAGASALTRAIVGGIDSGILRLGAVLEQDLQSGRLPPNVWQN